MANIEWAKVFRYLNDLLRFIPYDRLHKKKNTYAGTMPEFKDLTDLEKIEQLFRKDIAEPIADNPLAMSKLNDTLGMSYRQVRIIADYKSIDPLVLPFYLDAIEGHLAKDQNIERIKKLQHATGMTTADVTAILKGAGLDINEAIQGLADEPAIEGFNQLDKELRLGKTFIASILRGAGKDTAEAVEGLLSESVREGLSAFITETGVKSDFLQAVLKDTTVNIRDDVKALVDRKEQIAELLQEPTVNPKLLAKQITAAKGQGKNLADAVDSLQGNVEMSFQEKVLVRESGVEKKGRGAS